MMGGFGSYAIIVVWACMGSLVSAWILRWPLFLATSAVIYSGCSMAIVSAWLSGGYVVPLSLCAGVAVLAMIG